MQTLSGQLDKRPALEYFVGIDRNTGAYIPELAEQWEMAPDGKSWTITFDRRAPGSPHDGGGQGGADAAVNPKYIAEYAFPGTIAGYFTHLEYVKLVP